MKNLLKIIAVSFLLANNAQSRVGETLEECEARYGKSTGKSKGQTLDHEADFVFMKNGFEIRIQFWEKKAHQVTYRKIAEKGSVMKYQDISEVERKALQESNAPEQEWKNKPNLIVIDGEIKNTANNQLEMRYFSMANKVIFSKASFLEELKRRKAKREEDNLKGF